VKNRSFLSILPSFLLFFCQIDSSGQLPENRSGKPGLSEFEWTVYPHDSAATAVILYDYGKTFFLFPDVKEVNEFGRHSSGFRTVFYHYSRIKILDADAAQLADVEIPVYHTELAREEVSRLHGTTWNLENGKITRTRMNEDLCTMEVVDKNHDRIKLSLPAIRDGSILEIEYTVTSEFLYNLPSWKFQHSVPVIRSEYEVVIPEYYRYKQFLQGYVPVQTSSESRMRKIMLTYQEKPQGLTNRVATHTRDVEYSETSLHYLAENVGAFHSAEYLTTPENYISKVDFELYSSKFPGQAEELSSHTWGMVTRALLEDKDFGQRLTETTFLQAEALRLAMLFPDQVLRMKAAFELVRSKVHWNGEYGKLTSAPLDSIYSRGTGNVADINLLLVRLLRESGIHASPVVLSTRDNGSLDPSRATPDRINYVVASTTIGNNRYLVDAADPFSTVDLLPPQCLNGQGIIIDETGGAWLGLLPEEISTNRKNFELTMNMEGIFSGNIENKLTGYEAYLFRKENHSLSDVPAYLDKIMKANPGLRLTGWESTSPDSFEVPLTEKYACVLTGMCSVEGEVLAFRPLLTEAREVNPFRPEKRDFPVEFSYRFSEQCSVRIKIPEGCEILSVPSPLHIRLPGQAAEYNFNIDLEEDRIVCTSNLQINKMRFMPDEYAELRNFCEAVKARQAEKVILKKK
jgi:hypothetical protein